jgi:NAD(P)-dependent dehydrogenase (short-subunit alcohol dehydrogenase family)
MAKRNQAQRSLRPDSAMTEVQREEDHDRGVVVVTGASSGIGRATATSLGTRAFRVLAGVRSAADADRLTEAARVEPVIVDVTNAADVAALAERVDDLAGRGGLKALVNNAGIAVNAPVETIPMAEWRRQFEVNFFGHVAVTQALLPALLDSGGRVVNVSSIGGRVAGPTFGAYAASKFALEAMSDALRREVTRLGVHVVVIEPGSVATPIWEKGRSQFDELAAGMDPTQRGRYAGLVSAMVAGAEAMARGGIPPEAAAAVIVRAVEARRPRARYLVGRDAKLAARAARLLPDRLLDALIARSLGLSASADAVGGRRARPRRRQATVSS